MTLEDALAICLYLRDAETIEEHDERVLAAAHEVVGREARKAIAAFPTRPAANHDE